MQSETARPPAVHFMPLKSDFNARLSNYGLWTYRVAWILEIVAASIGLATGLALGYQAFEASRGSEISVTTIDLVLASAPFIMVALAELIKIPIATLLFAVKWIWKPILLVFLALLALITFETVFMGLERASAQRQMAYDDLRTELATLRVQRETAEANLGRSVEAADLQGLRDEIEQLAGLAQRELDEKVSEAARVQDQITNLRSRDPAYASLSSEIASVENALQSVKDERDREFETFGAPFERQRDSYVRRIDEGRAAGDESAVRRYTEELRRLRNPIPGINERFQPEINRLEGELRALRQREREFVATETDGQRAERETLQRRLDLIEQERQELANQWRARQNEAMDRLAAAQERSATRETEVETLRNEIQSLNQQIGELEQERIQIARTDQVRRLAGSVYGVAPENVEPDQASTVALVWFGSLGALAALAGPLTAMVALGLQRTAELRDRKPVRPLRRFLRNWLVKWRFRRVKRIPYEVKVEIEKLIEKPVDRIVEKTVKEIVYVPLLTDDPEALKKALEDGLPDNVSVLTSPKRDIPPDVDHLTSTPATNAPQANEASIVSTLKTHDPGKAEDRKQEAANGSAA